ncbi:hypothetical protein [Porphyromonas sp.]|uniref:hypothetical protein n=1 Tax=Porphyromonas sp. TaxID=1924944 RepID=UPI0026DDCA04|nr:hypothetical protein [Porphyromonas sp.]MDO4771435.1 hypothetical protein [Porphyromonas sp.]
MKKLSVLLATILFVVGLGGCKDGKKESYDIQVPYDINFEIKEGDVTSTTFSFEVKPSDKENPYVCLYVDKSVIDKVPKEELPQFLLKELKTAAAVENKKWEQFRDEIVIKGDFQKTLTNLLPGNLYELVVFGLKGDQISREISYLFFETPIADFVDVKFDVNVSTLEPNKVVLDVKPSESNTLWYYCSLPKNRYETAQAAGMSDAQLSQTILENELKNFFQMLPHEPTAQDIEEFVNNRFFKDEKQITMRGRGVQADTEYVYLLTAVYVSAQHELVFISNTQKGSFTTPKVPQKPTTFELNVENITQTKAAITVIPSDPTQKFVYRCDIHSEKTEKMTNEELAKFIIQTNPYISFEAMAHVRVVVPDYSLVPGTKHYLLAFGYDGGVSTKVYRIDFDPLPAGDPKTATFDVQKVRLTSDDVTINITANDKTVYYMPVLYPSHISKESIKGQIIASLRRSLDQTINSGFNPYASIWTIITQQAVLGDRESSFRLEPGVEYSLLIVTFDKKGIAADAVYEKSYFTAPAVSPDVKVDQVEIAGIFSGNDEAGQVFGQPDLVKDKAIMVLKYKVSPQVKDAYASANLDDSEGDNFDINAMSDGEILQNSNIRWSKINPKAPYLFVIVPWEEAQISYSYGVNDKHERGHVARAKVRAVKENEKESIDKLRQIRNEVSQASTSAVSMFSASLLRKAAKAEEIERYLPLSQPKAQVPVMLQKRPVEEALKGDISFEAPEDFSLIRIVK